MNIAENEAVLAYLYVEQLPSWRDSTSVWVVDGYSLSTHPDLCERVEEINAAAREPAQFRYLYGKPVLTAENGVIVAFANGTHTFCVRLPVGECDPAVPDEAAEVIRPGVSSHTAHLVEHGIPAALRNRQEG